MSISPESVAAIFKQLQHDNPRPRTELNYDNTYQLLVAVILSAQSTDKVVNQVTESLFARVKTPEDMLQFDELQLSLLLNRLGLYQQKAKYLLAMSRDLVDRFHSVVPESRQALESLAGVGRKTANVVLNTAFAQPVIAVDTHVFRVSRRLGLSQAVTPESLERDLVARIPREFLLDAHHWLVLHGRYVCQAKRPKCEHCKLAPWCEYLHL